jgi:recombination protein RecR
MNSSSKWIEAAVDQMSSLPGIGRKTALRLVLDVLRRSNDEVERFSSAFQLMKQHVQFCSNCHNLSDDKLCGICANDRRDKQTLCVVADIRDVMAVEGTSQFHGLYHVLGGLISPMDGIGPSDLTVQSLVERCERDEVSEIIFAFNATMEGETTAFYISKKLATLPITITSIARGIAVGAELEYTDEITLGRSLQQRVPYGKNNS